MSIEGMILFTICVTDMLLTLFFIQNGYAVEQNPLMRICLEHNWVTFVIVKTISFVPAIAILEWHKKTNPNLVSWIYKILIVLYIIVYILFAFAI